MFTQSFAYLLFVSIAQVNLKSNFPYNRILFYHRLPKRKLTEHLKRYLSCSPFMLVHTSSLSVLISHHIFSVFKCPSMFYRNCSAYEPNLFSPANFELCCRLLLYKRWKRLICHFILRFLLFRSLWHFISPRHLLFQPSKYLLYIIAQAYPLLNASIGSISAVEHLINLVLQFICGNAVY